MDEENGVHDVAALLKEFFRDLPDPLLTRDLYTAFLNTTRNKHTRVPKISKPPPAVLTLNLIEAGTSSFFSTVLDHPEQEQALQLLIFLLPACNSDTLHRLLCLLSTVAAHAEDRLDSAGQEVAGIILLTPPRSLKRSFCRCGVKM